MKIRVLVYLFSLMIVLLLLAKWIVGDHITPENAFAPFQQYLPGHESTGLPNCSDMGYAYGYYWGQVYYICYVEDNLYFRQIRILASQGVIQAAYFFPTLEHPITWLDMQDWFGRWSRHWSTFRTWGIYARWENIGLYVWSKYRDMRQPVMMIVFQSPIVVEVNRHDRPF